MMTRYGVYRSRAWRPLRLLAEIGRPFTSTPVIRSDRLAGPVSDAALLNTGSAAFLQISPPGQIPLLVDGDLILTESLAITLHTARCHGGTLGPKSPPEAALMDQWALCAATAIAGPARAILNTVEAGSTATPEGPSANPVQRPPLIDKFPAVRDWLVRCQQPPAFQSMWQGQQAKIQRVSPDRRAFVLRVWSSFAGTQCALSLDHADMVIRKGAVAAGDDALIVETAEHHVHRRPVGVFHNHHGLRRAAARDNLADLEPLDDPGARPLQQGGCGGQIGGQILGPILAHGNKGNNGDRHGLRIPQGHQRTG